MRKLRKNEGFTLAELLIVVAIIAVLVAVSIPIFTRQLEKSREATDRANLRAAKAAVVTALLDDAALPTTPVYYDAVKGILIDEVPDAKYGKGTTLPATEEDAEYNPAGNYKDAYIRVTFSNGVATIAWMGGSNTTSVTIDPTADYFYPETT